MILYGWDIDEINAAVAWANDLYKPFGGIPIETRDLEITSEKCRRGKLTVKLRLGFAGSTRKRKDKTYAPGVKYTTRSYPSYVADKIPFTEVGVEAFYFKGERRIVVEKTRSSGSLCWHMFGHFMAELFEKNPEGKIIGANDYDGIGEFYHKAQMPKGMGVGNCSCSKAVLCDFFK